MQQIGTVMQDLKAEGVPESSAVRDYIEKDLRSGYSQSWLQHLMSHTYMDDHLIMGAVSEMDFPLGTVVTSTLTSSKIMSAACKSSNTTDVQSVATRMKQLFMIGHDITLIVPVAHFINGTRSRHWGAAFVTEGQVYWGDSIKCAPFANVLTTVQKIIENIFPSKKWVCSDKNYIIDVLKYKMQKDGYSCGFYVVSAMCHFAESTGCIHAFGYTQKSDSKISENIRKSAIRAFFRRVKEIHDKERAKTVGNDKAKDEAARKKMNDAEIAIYINNRKYRFSTPGSSAKERSVRMSKQGGVLSHGVSTNDLPAYVTSLIAHGEHFQYRRTRKLATNRKGYTRVATYNCAKVRAGCKASLLGHYYETSKSTWWIVTKKGVHNHAALETRT